MPNIIATSEKEGKAKTAAIHNAKKISPDHLIPMGEEELKDF